MSVLHEETGEEVAARRAAEAADRQLAERVREAERLADAARKKELSRLIAALDLIEAAGELLRQAREIRAVRGGPLFNGLKPPPGPSLGGQTPENMELIQRQEASREQGRKNEEVARSRWLADQEEVIRGLTAGQSPANADRIRREIRVAAGVK